MRNALAEQIAAFCLSAIAGGVMLYLWRSMRHQDRTNAWRLYGWFCGLMMCDCGSPLDAPDLHLQRNCKLEPG
jgi:hypothetical protein